MTEAVPTTKPCSACGHGNLILAKFCIECGTRFAVARIDLAITESASQRASADANSPQLRIDPRATFETFVASLQPEEASSKLTSLIGMNRAQLKSQGVPLPKATNPILVSLMDSLKALPSTEISARIAIVTALGRMADPAVLPPLLLVTGAQSKDVRRATAIALGSIKHPLSAYLLLPMLLDGSSRVKQAAFQGLIQLNQPHTMESILAACPCSKSLRSLVVETLRLVSDSKRSEFFSRLAESTADQNPNLKVVADWLRFEFRNSITNARPIQQPERKSGSTVPPRSQPPKVEPANKSREQEGRATKQAVESQESSIFEWTKSEQPTPASASNSTSAYQQYAQASAAVNGSPGQNSYELSADFGQDDDYESDVRLVVDSNSSAADLDFFNSITQSLDDSHVEQDSESEMEFASSGSQAFMSLSGMLAAPENPMQARGQNSRLPHSNQVSSDYRAANHNNFGQAPWSAPQTSTPISAFDTAAMSGNTPGFSNPYLPMMPVGGMPANGMYPPGIPGNAMQPGMMQPGMMPVAPGFDMTASSPLVPAFTNVITHPATSAAIVSSQSSPSNVASNGQQSSQPAAVASIALPTNDEPAVDETALEQARAKEAHERALARLRKAREEAFRILLADSEDIPKVMPRLLKKRIATLMSTPSTKLDQTIEQIVGLGTTNSSAAIATLSSFCQKPAKQIREACARALGDIAHSGSAVLLMKLLADKSGTVVEAAIKSLTKLDLAPTRPVLLAAGLCGTNLRTVVSVGVESAADDNKTEWEKLLLEKLQDDDTESAAFAVSLLSRFVGDTHLEIFQNLASHKAPVLRAAAVEALARTQAKRAISQINSALEDTDPTVRAQAAMSVATMHSPRSVELLQKLVFDSNLTVRRNAAQSMSRIDEPDLAETIAKALDHETDPTTVEYLLAALQRNGAQSSLSILQRYIEGESSQFREQALKALRKLKIPASIPIFKRLLDDHTPAIRRQSIEQLAVLKSEGILPRLREMLKQDPDETVRASCAKAIGDFSDDTSVHLLEEALEDHALVRLQAVISLGRLAQSSAGPILLSLMRDQMPEIRYQAVRAIAQLKLEGVEEQIAPLLEDSDEMVRRGAEQSLKDLGQSIGTIRSKRLRKRFVKVASMLTPSSVAGVIPGGAKSLLAVIVAVMLVGGYWGLSRMSFVMAGGEKLPVGRVVSVALAAESKSAIILRKNGVLDVWSILDNELRARVRVPMSVESVIAERNGGVLLMMGTEIGRLDPESQYAPEELTSISLKQLPAAVYFHENTNSLCIFDNHGGGTTLRILDAVTLQETKTHEIKATFRGACTVSPDFKIAIMLDTAGKLSLCELSNGEVTSADIKQLTGNDQLGAISSVAFTEDMKHVAFTAEKGCLILSVETMAVVKFVPSPDVIGLLAAKGISGGSDLVILSRSGQIYKLTRSFESVSESPTGRANAFDLAAIGIGGDLFLLANTEGRDFDVYSITEQKMLISNPGVE